MGKSNAKKTRIEAGEGHGGSTIAGNGDDADDLNKLLDSMPIAQAVLQNDTKSMTAILESCIPGGGGRREVTVQDLTMEKSVGESFTGGRSTPVYFIQCQVCRQQRATATTITKEMTANLKPRSFVVKLVVMPNDKSGKRSDKEQVQRRRESYAVERRFYDTIAEHLRSNGLALPRLLASDLDGSKPWPAFCILMNNVASKFPLHPSFLSLQQAKCALKWIAKLHALFWGSSSSSTCSAAKTWRRDLWGRGAFWTTSTVKVDGISTAWTKTMRYLESKHPVYVTDRTKSLGLRIQKAGLVLSKFLAKQATISGEYGTLIHGDFKAANIFLTEASLTSDEGDANEVAVVDFQFAGAGLGCEDVAYFLYPDALGHRSLEDESTLLETYHDELILQLIALQKGGPSTMPFSVFRRYYELARLDMTRYWLSAKSWSASTEGEAMLVTALEEAMDAIDGGALLASENEYESALQVFINS